MRAPSTEWYSQIAKSRDCFQRSNAHPYAHPVFPWLGPSLHPTLASLINRWGVEKRLEAGESVLGAATPIVDRIVLVKSGITARSNGSPYAQKRHCFAFATPGHLACGNLNLFTGRPCMGTYFAIVPSVVVVAPQSLLRNLCEQDFELLKITVRQTELLNLSDRLGFSVHSLLNVEGRVLAYFLTWAAAFGRLVDIEGEDWVRMPVPIRGEALSGVVNGSNAAIARFIMSMRNSGDYLVKKNHVLLRLAVLDGIHNWVRNSEEEAQVQPRTTLRDYLKAHPL